MIVKLDEAGMLARGFDRAFVNYLRHLLTQIGELVGGQTLPDTVTELAVQGMDLQAATFAELRKDFDAAQTESDGAGLVAELSNRLEVLEQKMEQMRNDAAELAELRKFAQGLAVDSAFPAPLTDWEHPGRIGAKTASTGDFTVLSTGNGTEAVPSFFFGTDIGTGMYRSSLNNLRLTVNGVWLASYSPDLFYVRGKIGVDGGSAGAPAIFMDGNTATGFYRSAGNAWGFSTAGTQLLNLESGLATVNGAVLVSGQLASSLAPGTPPLQVASDTLVPNLYVARAQLADNATGANYAISAGVLTLPTTFPAAATDPATTMALVNAIRIAAIGKGL